MIFNKEGKKKKKKREREDMFTTLTSSLILKVSQALNRQTKTIVLIKQGRQSSQINATDPKFAHRPIQTAGIIAYLHKDKTSEKKKRKQK